MKKDDKLIPIDAYLKDFNQYLESNSRCIFSAKFGSGKSFFLSQFMDTQKNKYLFIPIYPINYQVSDNKDIFEYIKRDILIRLLSNTNVILKDEVIKTSLLLYNYFDNNKCDTLLDIFRLIPEINICGVDIKIDKVSDKIRDLRTKFKKYKEKNKTESEISEDFLSKFELQSGTIYEFDTISQLICDIIVKYKQDNEKQVVLVVEDLDRIDPNHLFRILNVFSAHFDRYTPSYEEFSRTNWKNKFCFDKIITVCDFENLRRLYTHLYGPNTDFNGYISKFTSDSPFRYSLKSDYSDYIRNHLIDKDLLKYPHLCNYLITQINQIPYINLRLLRIHFMDLSARIIDTPIPLNSLKGYSIKAINDFTKILVICKLFELSITDLLAWMNKSINSFAKDEVLSLVGSCWLLSDYFDANIKMKLKPGNIIYGIYVSNDERLNNETFPNCEIKDSIVEKFRMSSENWNNSAFISGLMFKQLGNIVSLLQEIIVLREEP